MKISLLHARRQKSRAILASLSLLFSALFSISIQPDRANAVPTTPVISNVAVNSISGATMDVKVTVSTSVAGLAGFQYSTDTGTTWSECNTSDCNWTTGNSYVIIQKLSNTNSSLQVGSTYKIILKACSSGTARTSSLGLTDCSAASNTYVYVAGVPDAPTITSITPGNQKLTVAFTVPASNGGSAITKYQYTTDGTNWVDTPTTTSPLSFTKLSSDVTISLTNGTTYPIQIRAVNSTGAGGSSNTVNGTPRTVPGAPTGVSGIVASSTSIDLSWTAPSDTGGAVITDYTIQYSSNGGTSWSTFSHTASTNDTITVTGLLASTSYIFKVAAVNAAGTGSYSSNSGSVTTSVAAANDATLFSGTVKGQSATLGTASSDTNVASAGAVTLTHVQASNTSNSGSYITSFVKNDTNAFLKVVKYSSGDTTTAFATDTAYNDTGTVANGDFFLARVVSADSSTTRFYRVNVTVQAPIIATSSTISNGAISPYVVVTSNYFKSSMTVADLTVDSSTTGIKFESITVTSSTSITLYFSDSANAGTVSITAKTSAFDPVGPSASNTLTITVGARAPNAPTAVSGSAASSSSVSLSWTAPTDEGGASISDYDIQYSSDNGSTWSTFTHTASTSTSMTVTGLSASTTYIFKVAGINSVGTGAYSANSSGVTTSAASSGSTPPAPAPAPKPPVITSISKSPVCSRGADLIIYGSDLGGSKVTVDDLPAEVRSSGGGSLNIYLPNASEGVKKITLTTTGGTATTNVTYVYKDYPTFNKFDIPFMYKGGEFSYTFSANLGLTYSYRGDIPAGLTFDPATGLISGTPTRDGIFKITLTATGFCGEVSQEITMDIDKDIPNAISYRIKFPYRTNNGIHGTVLSELKKFLEYVKEISPRNIDPVIILSGGGKEGTSDPGSGQEFERNNAICDILLTQNLIGQIITGLFTGPEDEIEIIVYWPKPS